MIDGLRSSAHTGNKPIRLGLTQKRIQKYWSIATIPFLSGNEEVDTIGN